MRESGEAEAEGRGVFVFCSAKCWKILAGLLRQMLIDKHPCRTVYETCLCYCASWLSGEMQHICMCVLVKSNVT